MRWPRDPETRWLIIGLAFEFAKVLFIWTICGTFIYIMLDNVRLLEERSKLYKERGKILERRQQILEERGEVLQERSRILYGENRWTPTKDG